MIKYCKECSGIIKNPNFTFCSNLCVCAYNRKQQRKRAVYKYYISPKKCLQCKKIIHILDNWPVSNTRIKKFCSHNCSARYNNKRRPPTSEITKAKQRFARMQQIFPRKDTIIEIMLQEELIKRNIIFTKHVPLIGQPDIFIEPNICIFADGTFWHGDPRKYKPNDLIGCGKNRKPAKYKWKYDKSITRRLRYRKYIVLRFWEKEIKENIILIIDKIEKII